MRRIVIFILFCSSSIFSQESVKIGVGINYTFNPIIQLETSILKVKNENFYGIKVGLGSGKNKITGEHQYTDHNYLASLSFQYIFNDFLSISTGPSLVISKREINELFTYGEKTGVYFHGNISIKPSKNFSLYIGITNLFGFDGKSFGISLMTLF